jgi:hypothetical protein
MIRSSHAPRRQGFQGDVGRRMPTKSQSRRQQPSYLLSAVVGGVLHLNGVDAFFLNPVSPTTRSASSIQIPQQLYREGHQFPVRQHRRLTTKVDGDEDSVGAVIDCVKSPSIVN